MTILFGGVDIFGSPLIGIDVNVGLAEAMYSDLVASYNPLIAGQLNTFKIQAKDIFSNPVIDTNEIFDFEIKNLATNLISHSQVSYQFSLYDA